jgi:hypothetical protein
MNNYGHCKKFGSEWKGQLKILGSILLTEDYKQYSKQINSLPSTVSVVLNFKSRLKQR